MMVNIMWDRFIDRNTQQFIRWNLIVNVIVCSAVIKQLNIIMNN